MSEQPVTSAKAIGDLTDRYPVTEAQAQLLVAKTAVAKLVSSVADEEMFVLKGGTLLHHVHDSPRASLADIDYGDGRKEKSADVETVKGAIGAEHDFGFRLDVDAGKWEQKGGLVSGAEIPVFLTKADADGHPVNISVAVRAGEVLDGEVVDFKPVGLTDGTVFSVHAVSLAEAAAEKIIAWCLKGKPKHFHDLAYIARKQPGIDHKHVAGMVMTKFYAEKDAEETKDEYIERSLTEPADLHKYWIGERRMTRLRSKWPDQLGTELILEHEEIERETDSLADFDTVYKLVTECFDGVFDQL